MGRRPGRFTGRVIHLHGTVLQRQGVHNVLYEYSIIDTGGVASGYPGNSYIDVVGTDFYGELTSTSGPSPGYSALVGYSKPITFAEYNCSTQLQGGSCATSYSFDTMLQDVKICMPKVVLMNFWWGPNPGNASYSPADGANSYWSGFMEDPYGIMQAEVPSLGR